MPAPANPWPGDTFALESLIAIGEYVQAIEPDECDAPANDWRPYIFGEGEPT